MLNGLRAWFSRNEQAPEPPPVCFVISPDAALRERLACKTGELGLMTETFAEVGPALQAARLRQPRLVFFDLACGAQQGSTLAGVLTGGKLCGLQLVSTEGVRSYEQICAVGQIRIAGDRQGLRLPPMLEPPFSADALRRIVQDLGCARTPAANRPSRCRRRYSATGLNSGISRKFIFRASGWPAPKA